MAKFKKGHALIRTDELRRLKIKDKLHPDSESPFSPEEQEVFEAQVEEELDREHESLTDAEEANMLMFDEIDQMRHPLNQPPMEKLDELPATEFAGF
jgi:hypothetical protein